MKALLPILSIAATIFSSCSSPLPPPQTVTNFKLEKFDGEWHEIARLPNSFEKDLVAAKAIYGIGTESPISIKNTGLKADGTVTEIQGSADVVGDGKLKVRFAPFPANLFTGDYWILWINKPYTEAVVGSPSRKFLWLLSKNPQTKAQDFTEALQLVKAQGFPVNKLIENPQRLEPEKRHLMFARKRR